MEAPRRLSTPYQVRIRSVPGPYQVRIYNYGEGTEKLRRRYGPDTEIVRRSYGEDTEKALPYTKTLQVSVSAGIKIVSLPDKSSWSVCRLRFGV